MKKSRCALRFGPMRALGARRRGDKSGQGGLVAALPRPRPTAALKKPMIARSVDDNTRHLGGSRIESLKSDGRAR
jgi:hypothetical protein